MDFIGFLYGFGVVHGFVLAGILLFVRAGRRAANVFMALLVVSIALRFLAFWLQRSGVYLEYPQWALAVSPLDFAWGPLLYLYAYAMSGRQLAWNQVWHFLPCFVLFAAPLALAQYAREVQLDFLQYLWGDRQDASLREQALGSVPVLVRYYVDLHLHGALFSVQFAIYCYLVLRQIRHHNENLERNYSYTDRMNLRWLHTLTWCCVLFLGLFLVFNRAWLLIFGHIEVTHPTLNLPFLFLVFCIYVMGIAAVYQPRIGSGTSARAAEPVAVVPHSDVETQISDAEPAEAKYARSGITLEDAQRFKIQLMETMQAQQLYLDCDLTLGELADRAGLSYHQASQVINGQLNQRFFSFVNSYRIDLAKQMLADPQTAAMPIVELAVEVGFKSKSSFYDAFKKATAMTPTQYKKSLEQA